MEIEGASPSCVATHYNKALNAVVELKVSIKKHLTLWLGDFMIHTPPSLFDLDVMAWLFRKQRFNQIRGIWKITGQGKSKYLLLLLLLLL